MNNQTVKEGKLMAVIAYLWWIGTVIAFVKNMNLRNSFISFHIRQMLGLLLLHLISGIIIKYISGDLGYLMFIGICILWIIGIVGASKGQTKLVPFIGDKFQEWFKGIS